MPINLPARPSRHKTTQFLYKLGETDFVDLVEGPDTIQDLLPDEEVRRLASSIAQRIPLEQVCKRTCPRPASLPRPTGQPRRLVLVPKPEPIAAIQPTRKLEHPPTRRKNKKSTFMRYMRLLPSVKELRHRPPPIPADDDSCNLYEDFSSSVRVPVARPSSLVSRQRGARRTSSHRTPGVLAPRPGPEWVAPPKRRSMLRNRAFLAVGVFALAVGVGMILAAPAPSPSASTEVQGAGEKIHFTIKTIKIDKTEVQRSERPLATPPRTAVRETSRSRQVRSRTRLPPSHRRRGRISRDHKRRGVDVDALLSAGNQPSGVSPDAILAAGRRAKRVTRRPRQQRLHLPRWAM